jgi:integrase
MEWLKLIDWASKYIEYSETRFTYKTFKEKRSIFKRFFKNVDPTLTVNRLKPVDVLNYLRIQVKNRSGYAANKDRKNLLAAWNWGIKYLDLPSPNPCLVERFPENRHTRYVPPEKDFWKVYETAEGEDKVMLLGYLHLAARRSELFRLRWEDVDFGSCRVRIGTRKRLGGHLEYEWLPMTDELFGVLFAHRQRAKSQWVFADRGADKPFTVRQHFMKKLCEKASVKPFGFHAVRHLTASILAQADVPMVTIQRILRHKNLMTTERYIRGLEPVKPALEILSRRNSRPNVPTTVDLRDHKMKQAV